ncbi:MAG TPA: crotonase/enoyl-CoA hydratase family protein [Ramlibacter sp.]|jgi:enoyl-CoA hydratase/carnithine racemase|nr:crotonase/enoyl-CoA hydratase family protein [Ramlibacter sp.]
MTAFIDLQTHDGVAVMTMNSPQTRNVLGFGEQSREIEAACARIAADRGIRAVVLTGAGKAFSAGGDIKNMVARLDNESLEPIDDRYYYKEGIHRIPRALYELEVPTIAAVNGPAIGAGLDLACMCDLRIAAQSATFAESFVKLGIIPGDGGAFLLQRIVGISKAAELTFTGDTIDAAEALACGLVSQVVADDQLLEVAMAKAQRIARNPPHALRMAKRLLRESQHLRLESVLELSSAFQALAHSSSDHRERITRAVDAMAKKG